MNNKKQKTKKQCQERKPGNQKNKEKKQRQERIEKKKKQELDIGIFVQPHFRSSKKKKKKIHIFSIKFSLYFKEKTF